MRKRQMNDARNSHCHRRSPVISISWRRQKPHARQTFFRHQTQIGDTTIIGRQQPPSLDQRRRSLIF
jgi:hypothetical protein